MNGYLLPRLPDGMKGSRMQTRRERDEGHVFAGASPAVCAENTGPHPSVKVRRKAAREKA